MKKIYYLVLVTFILLLSACSQENHIEEFFDIVNSSSENSYEFEYTRQEINDLRIIDEFNLECEYNRTSISRSKFLCNNLFTNEQFMFSWEDLDASLASDMLFLVLDIDDFTQINDTEWVGVLNLEDEGINGIFYFYKYPIEKYELYFRSDGNYYEIEFIVGTESRYEKLTYKFNFF